jgi:polyferredoxin
MMAKHGKRNEKHGKPWNNMAKNAGKAKIPETRTTEKGALMQTIVCVRPSGLKLPNPSAVLKCKNTDKARRKNVVIDKPNSVNFKFCRRFFRSLKTDHDKRKTVLV